MKTSTTIDRAVLKWPSGPWDNEPDKAEWTDPTTGLFCRAIRHPISGHWCGYVGVTEGHPWYEKPYQDIDVSVHGGLTFSDRHDSDQIWWLGFDCHHAYDLSPLDETFMYPKSATGSTYKPLDYVQQQCTILAAQIMEQQK